MRCRRAPGVTVGPDVTELIERWERKGEFAEQLYVHGLGVQTTEGLAEWLHSEVRRGFGIPLDLQEIGMTLSDGHAVVPEQSTAAIIAHHPQAVYLGMKSGFIPADKAPDELIAGTERGGALPVQP